MKPLIKIIRDKFLRDYDLASQNDYDDWQDQPMSALALVILFDQFSRNMFRNDKKAFAQDHKARLNRKRFCLCWLP